MTKSLFLNIHGCTVNMLSDSDFVFENLKKDFTLYICKKAETTAIFSIKISLLKKKPPYDKVPPLEASFYNTGSICYRHNKTYYIDYGGEGLMIYDFVNESGELYSEEKTCFTKEAG